MKYLSGTVLSVKSKPTIVVQVNSFVMHPLYKKRVKRSQKYLTHSEHQVKVGDRVTLRPIRPMSKRKKWQIIKDQT